MVSTTDSFIMFSDSNGFFGDSWDTRSAAATGGTSVEPKQSQAVEDKSAVWMSKDVFGGDIWSADPWAETGNKKNKNKNKDKAKKNRVVEKATAAIMKSCAIADLEEGKEDHREENGETYTIRRDIRRFDEKNRSSSRGRRRRRNEARGRENSTSDDNKTRSSSRGLDGRPKRMLTSEEVRSKRRSRSSSNGPIDGSGRRDRSRSVSRRATTEEAADPERATTSSPSNQDSGANKQSLPVVSNHISYGRSTSGNSQHIRTRSQSRSVGRGRRSVPQESSKSQHRPRSQSRSRTRNSSAKNLNEHCSLAPFDDELPKRTVSLPSSRLLTAKPRSKKESSPVSYLSKKDQKRVYGIVSESDLRRSSVKSALDKFLSDHVDDDGDFTVASEPPTKTRLARTSHHGKSTDGRRYPSGNRSVASEPAVPSNRSDRDPLSVRRGLNRRSAHRSRSISRDPLRRTLERNSSQRSLIERSGSQRSLIERSGSQRSLIERSGSQRSLIERSGSQRSLIERSGSQRSLLERSGSRRSLIERSGSQRSLL
ncbi:unnamed protein product [Pseudo-nitzschia multistriata]|uniref:Uncharacterized protein n=1 Tax=Pseudo-nitzschia multistriata TaxID=183589 RepID=A0A448Z2T2_9STRA|nr:unnamed protein product [Pseudo-nitzschia multistriata]